MPMLPKNTTKYVSKRALGLSKPLTCYRCQQDFTLSLAVGNMNHLY